MCHAMWVALLASISVGPLPGLARQPDVRLEPRQPRAAAPGVRRPAVLAPPVPGVVVRQAERAAVSAGPVVPAAPGPDRLDPRSRRPDLSRDAVNEIQAREIQRALR